MNFKESIKDYLVEIISLIILIISSTFLFFQVYYTPLKEYTKTIEKLSSKYKQEELNIHLKLEQMRDKKEVKIENDNSKLKSVPSLLVRINNTFLVSNVSMKSLEPFQEDPFRFKLEFISNYFDFLNVLSEFEKLNININSIDVKPLNDDIKNPKHLIVFDISAIDGGERLSKKAVEFLDAQLNKKMKRDPFQQFTNSSIKTNRIINLTWVYKLSGIGKIGGKYVATIEHKPYFKDDSFKDLKVLKIDSNSVILGKETKNGLNKYILKFRN
jgi:hypothetical protein